MVSNRSMTFRGQFVNDKVYNNPLKFGEIASRHAIFFLRLIEWCDVTNMTKCSRRSVARLATSLFPDNTK